MNLLKLKLYGFKKLLKITQQLSKDAPELTSKRLKLERSINMIERINKFGFESLYTKESVLSFAKEVREVNDAKEAARLVQSDNWIIVNAFVRENGIAWVLIRLGCKGGRNMDAVEKALFEDKVRDEAAMKKAARPRGTDSAKVIKVIQTTALLGRGNHDDPVRMVTQYWDFDGNLLASSE